MTKKLINSLISLGLCLIAVEGNITVEVKAEQPDAVALSPTETPFKKEPPVGGINIIDYFTIAEGANSHIDKKAANVLVVTDNERTQKGGVWSKKKLDLTKPAVYESKIYIGGTTAKEMGGNDGQIGGDGMTLTFHNDPRGYNAIGGAGAAIGAYRRPDVATDVRIANALSFELDTYVNYDESSVQGTQLDGGIFWRENIRKKLLNRNRHIGFVYTDMAAGKANHQEFSTFEGMGLDVDNWYDFTFEWTPHVNGTDGYLKVTANNVTKTHRIYDYRTEFKSSSVYWGFTGSTGFATALQALAITKLPQEPKPNVEMKVYNSKNVDVSNSTVLEGEKLRYSIDVSESGGDFVLNMKKLTDLLPNELDYLGNAKITDKNGVTKSLTAGEISGKNITFLIDETVSGSEVSRVDFDVVVRPNTVGKVLNNISDVYVEGVGYSSNNVRVAVVNANTVVEANQLEAIRAKNIQINDYEVGALTLSRLNHMADAFAWKLTDGELLTFVTDMSAIKPTEGIYQVTFKTSKGTTKTINVHVMSGGIPVIADKTPVVRVKKGDTVNVLANITAWDKEDLDITPVASGELDTSETGVKLMTYIATDQHGNVDEVDRTYIIESDTEKATLVDGDKYVIFSSDFTKRVGQVVVSEEAVLKAANTRAYVVDNARRVGVKVEDYGTYQAVQGAYTLKYSVRDDGKWMGDAIKVGELTASAVGTVIKGENPEIEMDKDIIVLEAGDEIDIYEGVFGLDLEDGDLITPNDKELDMSQSGVQVIRYTATDSDGNVVTKDRTYVIETKTDKAIIGEKYVIFATNFIKRVGDVNTNEEAMIIAANARGFLLSDGSTAELEVISSGGYSAFPARYTIEYGVKADQSTTIKSVGTVIGGNPPQVMVEHDVIKVKVGETIDLLAGVTVTDVEDIKLEASTNDVVDITKSGVYIVKYLAEDSDGNVGNGERVYVVETETEKAMVGERYVIFTSNFTRRVSEVDLSEEAIIEAANVRGFHLSDGTSAPVEILDTGDYQAALGTYTIEYGVKTARTAFKSAIATVTAGEVPVITVTEPIMTINTGDEINPSLGVTVTDPEGETLVAIP
ncbi:MAG: lectin-like domain-containing protein, partial [Culicoidibacterales bacterium]